MRYPLSEFYDIRPIIKDAQKPNAWKWIALSWKYGEPPTRWQMSYQSSLLLTCDMPTIQQTGINNPYTLLFPTESNKQVNAQKCIVSEPPTRDNWWVTTAESTVNKHVTCQLYSRRASITLIHFCFPQDPTSKSSPDTCLDRLRWRYQPNKIKWAQYSDCANVYPWQANVCAHLTSARSGVRPPAA